MAYLFETDAISEDLKPKSLAEYVRWLETIPRAEQFTSAVVVGELFKAAFRSPSAARHIRNIESRVLPVLTVIPYDLEVARVSPCTTPSPDRAVWEGRIGHGPMDRHQRLKALGLERVLILDRGNVELALPPGWTVERDPAGHLACKDPTDSCKLEVSYLTLPPLPPGVPPLAERLRLALAGLANPSPAVTFRRGRVEFAWTEYVFESDDTERGKRREAHGRLLLAANAWFQAVLTFSYWTDDSAWAVPIWERIVETIDLGNGVPLETPKDHWSLRDP